jgi:hypothetical protein
MGTSAVRRGILLAAVSFVLSSALLPPLFGGEEAPVFPKRIAKEPAYTAPVQYYALLVLGADESLRVWLVADGDRLYADVNGDGDLTETGKRFDAFRSMQDDFIPLRRTWRIPKLGGSDRYANVEVSLSFFNPKWRPRPGSARAEEMTRYIEAYAKTANANGGCVHLNAGGRLWLADAVFATSKSAAPVFRMDTKSFELGVIETLVPHTLSRRPGLETLGVGVGAAGWGGRQPGCFSWVDFREFGKFALPVVEVEFPAEGGGYLPVRRYQLPGGC